MQGAPTHIVTHKETLSRYALARKYPGKYSLTVERNGWLTRYVSATPDTALAEAWLNTLSEEAPDIWSLIDRQDGHGFFMHVKDGVVREAKHIDLEEVSDIKLKLSKQVYVTDPLYSEVTDENAPWKESNTKRVSALSESDVNLYALKANRIPLIAASVASFLLIILTAGMMWSASSPHQVDVAPHVAPDTFQHYRSTMATTLSASYALKDVHTLLTYSALAPYGWTMSNVELKGKTVASTLSRAEHGLLESAQHYLAKHSLNPHATLTLNTLTLSAPLTAHLTEWETDIAPYESRHAVIDTLIKLGWSITRNSEQSMGVVNVLDFKLKKSSLLLHEVRSLSSFFANWPIGLTTFTLTPNSDETFSVEIGLKYIGDPTL